MFLVKKCTALGKFTVVKMPSRSIEIDDRPALTGPVLMSVTQRLSLAYFLHCRQTHHRRLRCRWPIAQCAMRPNSIVMPSPLLDDDLSFSQRVEDLTVQSLVPQFAIKALAVAILPRAAWHNVRRLRAHSG